MFWLLVAGVLKHQRYALWTIHPIIQAEHITKNDFTNILFIWHFWINIKNIAKNWKIRSTSSPLPRLCVSYKPTRSPGFSRCPRGYRLWSLFRKQLKSMAAQLWVGFWLDRNSGDLVSITFGWKWRFHFCWERRGKKHPGRLTAGS